MHINAISCGQGAPSLFLIVAAGEGLFPAEAVIVADTGWENDMLWNDGRRTGARTFFEEVTQPLAEEYGMTAHFVRAQNKHGQEIPALPETQNLINVDLPLFGSEGGKLKQGCTSKWKIPAVRQQLRSMGAKTATTNLGLTMDEVHRIRPSELKWNSNAYPLIDNTQNKRYYRSMAIEELERRGIPYLVTTECDGCPHKDLPRWQRTSPQTIELLTQFEARFNGNYFLTRELVPLPEAIKRMEARQSMSIFDSCDSGYCFT